MMLPSNTAAAASAADNDSCAVNGASCAAVSGVNSEVNGSGESCYTPVNDPDSIALLAAMCEANRFNELLVLCFIQCMMYS